MVKTISTPGKINASLQNIKANQPKLVDMWIVKKLTKFQGNLLSLSENIANSFRGLHFRFLLSV